MQLITNEIIDTTAQYCLSLNFLTAIIGIYNKNIKIIPAIVAHIIIANIDP